MLIVEDDIDFAEGLRDALEIEGHNVTVAHSAEEAIDVARARRFDLTIMDVRLPKMDGIEALAALRTNDPDAAIVVMTAMRRTTRIRTATARGAIAVLKKPLPMDRVFQILDELKH